MWGGGQKQGWVEGQRVSGRRVCVKAARGGQAARGGACVQAGVYVGWEAGVCVYGMCAARVRVYGMCAARGRVFLAGV